MKRAILFVPKSELEAYFRGNTRQDIKIVAPALMTDALCARLLARGKDAKGEVPFDELCWRHSSAEEPNRVCNSADFAHESISPHAVGPLAISFANHGSVETYHHHEAHWEIYFSEHKMGAEYRLPGQPEAEEFTMDEGGAIVFGPGIAHRMRIYGLTIVLEVPAVLGDREKDE